LWAVRVVEPVEKAREPNSNRLLWCPSQIIELWQLPWRHVAGLALSRDKRMM